MVSMCMHAESFIWYFCAVYDYAGKADLSIVSFAAVVWARRAMRGGGSALHDEPKRRLRRRLILASLLESKKKIGGNHAFHRDN